MSATEAPVRVVECPGCGSTFTTTVETKVYCGRDCKVRAKRRRERERRPPPPPREASPCAGCGVLLQQEPLGRGLLRCGPCRALRALERARERRREEQAAVVAAAMEAHPHRQSRGGQ